MKTIFFKLTIIFSVIFFATNGYAQTTTPSLKVGTFELYRTITVNDIKTQFGEYSDYDKALDENYRGQTVDLNIYYYYYQNTRSMGTKLQISTMENRIKGFSINQRDPKYAINGKLMIGDPISKISELGYPIERNDYFTSQNYLHIYPPLYVRGEEEICYYIEIYYDKNNNIKRIYLKEDTGI